MTFTLYGSIPSPYVRRIRLYLEGIEHEFKALNIYDDLERQAFAKLTPIRKLPILQAGETVLFDSHSIAEYLREYKREPAFSHAQRNLIHVIDAAIDSLIVLFLSQRSDLPVDEDRLYFRLQRERLSDSLTWLEQQAQGTAFDQWHYPSMALVALMDWAEFRNLHSFAAYPALQAARHPYTQYPSVLATAPHA